MLSSINAGPRLDRLPISGFHRRILWLIGGGMFLDSFDIYLAGGVLGALAKSGWSTMQLNATFLSATFVGMLLGALTAGVLGDRKGRKFTYQFNLAIFGLASLAGAFAPNMTWLIVCRFFMGLGLGAEIVVGYGSLGEFVPPAVRGKWSAYLSLITNSALFFSTFLGYLIIPSIGWRAMFAIVGVGALVMWFVRAKMPESPRWLESKGRFDEADAILRAAEAESARGGELPPVRQMPPVVTRPTTLLDLFTPSQIRRTVVAICVQIGINVVIYGFIVWVPTFLMKQGIGMASSLGYTTLMSLGGPAGALVGVLVADRIGRKNGMIAVSALAAVVGWAYGHSSSVEMATALGFLLFTLTYLMVALGIATYCPELFATENRMRGNGVAGCAGRIAGILAPQMVVALYASGGIQQVLTTIACVLAAMSIVLALFGIETNRRSLEDIAPNAGGLGTAGLGESEFSGKSQR
ncbi:MFS transporter [Pandoraea cepalis]|uniref:MFS transporter n=2 Tax=Pandoraea TaxID=93217 RepID=A0AAW7MHF6_9BURK|nr:MULTISPECIES: MFS transporter [Pandoraea]MDN4572184.1 MFS transporter [Pandoraea cepalis]MDN4578418.1 MFS transporter [Pandoraea cepalis]VVD94610.1 Inner membrane metabolite transport protein YdjE [Pandoraea soli]